MPMPSRRTEVESSQPREAMNIGFIARLKGLMMLPFARAFGPMHLPCSHEQRSDPFLPVASAPGTRGGVAVLLLSLVGGVVAAMN